MLVLLIIIIILIRRKRNNPTPVKRESKNRSISNYNEFIKVDMPTNDGNTDLTGNIHFYIEFKSSITLKQERVEMLKQTLPIMKQSMRLQVMKKKMKV